MTRLDKLERDLAEVLKESIVQKTEAVDRNRRIEQLETREREREKELRGALIAAILSIGGAIVSLSGGFLHFGK